MSRISDASHLIKLLTDGQITGLDSLTNLLTGGGAAGEPETIYSHRAVRVAGADAQAPSIGQFYSLWQYEGTPIGHGEVPTSFVNPTNATQGGLLQTDPGGGRKKYLASMAGVQLGKGTLILCDRLAHMGGMSGTVTTAQNVNGGVSGDVTRYTDGVGNWLCLEIYTTIGTATTVTAAYKDGADAAKTTQPVAFAGTSRQRAQQIVPLSLAAGGSTVKGCTSVTLAGSTGTVGDFGITILHPLLILPMGVLTSGNISSFLNGPMPEIKTDACLQLIAVAGTSASATPDTFFTFVEA